MMESRCGAPPLSEVEESRRSEQRVRVGGILQIAHSAPWGCWTRSPGSGENRSVPEHGTSGPAGGPRWPLAVALLIIGGVATADVISGDRAVLIGLMTSATLLCALTASPALTRSVGIVAVTVAAL